MTYRGHIRNGQVSLDEPAQLPEGAQVRIQVVPSSNGNRDKHGGSNGVARKFRPIQMPGGSLADDLIRDRR